MTSHQSKRSACNACSCFPGQVRHAHALAEQADAQATWFMAAGGACGCESCVMNPHPMQKWRSKFAAGLRMLFPASQHPQGEAGSSAAASCACQDYPERHGSHGAWLLAEA